MVLNWPDGHESRFRPEFFTKYGPNGTSPDHSGYSAKNHPKVLWYGNHEIGTHDFNSLKVDELALFNYLRGINEL